jgi:hypothetical protein
MAKKLNRKLINKMNDVGIDIAILGSLSRILIKSMRNSENLKYFDAESLASVLRQKIASTHYKYEAIIKKLNI